MAMSSRVKSVQEAAKHCMDLVQRVDNEHYVSTVLAPTKYRGAFFGLRAFNAELASISESAKDPRTASMRFQWWRTTLDQIYGGEPPQQPTALFLTPLVLRNNWKHEDMMKIIDAREQTTGDVQPQSVQELEYYGEMIHSTLYHLALDSLGVEDEKARHAASHLGRAMGMVLALRGTPVLALQRKVSLPQDLIEKTGTKISDITRGQSSEQLTDAVFQLASTANAHVEQCRAFAEHIPKEAQPALLPAVFAHRYLQRLQEANFQIFSPAMTNTPRMEPLALRYDLWQHNRKGKY